MLIRWAIQNGTSVIPKATGVSHIQGNLDALNFELSQEEFQVGMILSFSLSIHFGTHSRLGQSRVVDLHNSRSRHTV